MLRAAADRHNMKLITEVMDISQLELIERRAHPPGRRAQHAELHAAARATRAYAGAAQTRHLGDDRGVAAFRRIHSGWRQHERDAGERGIRTFESYTRNTFDISAIPVIQKLSHLPILADPSHGTGRRDQVAPMARAAVAAGADGLLIEVHCDPDHALSDGAQSLHPPQFDRLMAELRIIAPAIGRGICLEPVAKRGWGV